MLWQMRHKRKKSIKLSLTFIDLSSYIFIFAEPHIYLKIRKMSYRPPKLEILIVDDDRVISFLEEKILSGLEIPVPFHSFFNGKEALEYLEKSTEPEKHFPVLLDINMPVMNGWEFLNHIQS